MGRVLGAKRDVHAHVGAVVNQLGNVLAVRLLDEDRNNVID